jgi:DNA polymerase III epsilon subunit-like protein
MNSQLFTKVNEVVEELRVELHQQASRWNQIRTPVELFDLEQELQATLNTLQSKIVESALEEIHRETAFLEECEEIAARQCGVEFRGWRSVSVRTLTGKKLRIKTPYSTLPNEDKPDDKVEESRREGTGIYPVLRQLGIVRGATPRLLAEVTRQMADGPSAMEVEERFANREIMLAEHPMWLYVRDFGGIALWQRHTDLANLNDIEASELAPLAGKRVVVGLDGGRLRIRVNRSGQNEIKHKSYSTSKCEPKLFIIYTIDHNGNKEPNGEVAYDGTIQSAEYLFLLLTLRLKQLGAGQAKLLVITGDGARWIWNGVSKLHQTLGLERSQVVEIIDWAHAVEKLTTPARLGIENCSQQQKWIKQMRKLLRQGQTDKIVEALLELDRHREKQDDIGKTIEYFQTHKSRMRYDRFKADGLPLGSGAIESGIRRIVNLRLKGASIFWRPETAEEILYLRCQIKSGQWFQFVKSVLSRWAKEINVSLSQAHQLRKQIADQFLVSHPPKDVNLRHQVIKWANNLLQSKEVLIIDTETTGLNGDDEIIQLGIINLKGNTLLDTLLKPSVPIAPEAGLVHGITHQDLRSAPAFVELYNDILELVDRQCLVTFNADFDRRLLDQTCQKYGLPKLETVNWDCAMEKYAQFWGQRNLNGGYKRQSLITACNQQGIRINGTHEAIKDSLLTLELIKAMAVADVEE